MAHPYFRVRLPPAAALQYAPTRGNDSDSRCSARLSPPAWQDVDWANIRAQQPPFVPQLQSITDTSYFPVDELAEVPEDPTALTSTGMHQLLGDLEVFLARASNMALRCCRVASCTVQHPWTTCTSTQTLPLSATPTSATTTSRGAT